MGLGMMLEIGLIWWPPMWYFAVYCILFMLKYLFNKYSLFFSNFILNFYHKNALNRMVESWFH